MCYDLFLSQVAVLTCAMFNAVVAYVARFDYDCLVVSLAGLRFYCFGDIAQLSLMKA